MLGGLFRIVLFVFVLYLAYVFYRILRASSRAQKSARKPRRIQGLMVKDEVCNTYIPKDEAIKEVRGGRECYFCSEECRRKARTG
jgi:YHS domain-containing protein